MTRRPIDKTLKMYVDGRFIRPESGRVTPIHEEGRVVNVPRASRKDLRDAVRAARAAQPGWAAATAMLRGQILYRLAEMLEGRGAPADAVDRAVFYAGWADKLSAVLSTLNPIAASYVNYSRLRPVGVVVAAAPADAGWVGLVEAACAPTLLGNAVIVVADAALGTDAAGLAEALATSDWPSGVVNVLTADPAEILVEAARHDDIDAILLVGAAGEAVRGTIGAEGAASIQRLVSFPDPARPARPSELQALAEVQTVWVSAHASRGGGAGY